MRKLLVLVAVFAISSMASGMTVTITGTETSLELNVAGATYNPYLAIVIDAPGVLSNFAAGPEAPRINASFGAVTIGGASGEVWGLGVGPTEAYQDGVWLTADRYTTVAVNVYAYETLDVGASWILREMLHTQSTPEPMTVALLGFGGLFILRRRRHK